MIPPRMSETGIAFALPGPVSKGREPIVADGVGRFDEPEEEPCARTSAQ
jgi:hypothetical protein